MDCMPDQLPFCFTASLNKSFKYTCCHLLLPSLRLGLKLKTSKPDSTNRPKIDPAELYIFSLKVVEFERTVETLFFAHVNEWTSLLDQLAVQQLYFKEKPWVSHFVPHLDIVLERLNRFMHTNQLSLPASHQSPPRTINIVS